MRSSPPQGGGGGYAAVEPELAQGSNRVQEAGNPAPVEQKPAPVMLLPEKIKAGEPCAVTVMAGAVLHPMSPAHSIQDVELLAGNEPAGRMEFTPGFNPGRSFLCVSTGP